MSALIVIPARYDSTRLPGKPLLKSTGKFLIQHVYERVTRARRAQTVVVATDDSRIIDAVRSFHGMAVLTRRDHESGTDRIAEVAARPEFQSFQTIVNVQGDEPEVSPELIDDLIRLVEVGGLQMTTAAAPFDNHAQLSDPGVVKVVTDHRRFALYFSRSVIPFDRDGLTRNGGMLELAGLYRKHLGIYAYHRNFLLEFCAAAPCELEKLEKLEQLRALYLGAKILVQDTPAAPHGIDTPEDYQAFCRRMMPE